MPPIVTARRGRSLLAFLLLVSSVSADDAPKPDSPLVRLLKKAPPERQGPIVSRLGQIGTPADLGFLLDQATRPEGFAAPIRRLALDALADAALTRKQVKPDGDLANLGSLFDARTDPTVRLAAIRLAGLWKVEPLIPSLSITAKAPGTDDATLAAAIRSLGEIGATARDALLSLNTPSQPKSIRVRAVAALANIDPADAAGKATELIREAEKNQDLTPLLAAFLNRQGGAETLAKALADSDIKPDNAKLALRATYALGRADPALVAILSKSAGIDAEVQPPTKEEMEKLVAEVASRGNAERGEQIFRRADLSCMKCHAISGAAGGVGPDLSSVGLSSPVDYVINSILLPDQAIKEQYHTLVVATTNGQVFSGIVADKDDKKLVLREATGDLRTVPTSEIDESKPGGSLMPKGLSNLLTRDEFLDLVRFVSELGKPGRYALHATPTIQRWRLMKPVPEELAARYPDPGTFVAKLRDSDPSNWTPVYALASGELPVDEWTQLAGSRVLYLRGEIEVTAPGKLTINLGCHHGINAWLDDVSPDGAPPEFDWVVTPGRHIITVRVDTTDSKLVPVSVKIAKAKGSTAEFTVVGGR